MRSHRLCDPPLSPHLADPVSQRIHLADTQALLRSRLDATSSRKLSLEASALSLCSHDNLCVLATALIQNVYPILAEGSARAALSVHSGSPVLSRGLYLGCL